MPVIEIGIAELDVAIQPVDEEVHPTEPIGEVLGFLTDEGQPLTVPGEEIGLDEHAAGATAGIEDHALLGRQHRNQRPYDADRGEILAAPLALGAGKLADEVLIDAADQISPAVVLLEHVSREEVDEAGDILTGKVGSGVRPWQEAAELVRVGLLEGFQRIVEAHLDVVGLGVPDDLVPTRRLRHDERANRSVLVGFLEDGSGLLGVLRVVLGAWLLDHALQLVTPALVSQGEEAQEDDGQDVPFVVRRLDRAAEVHSGFPELAGQLGVAVAG